LAVCVPAAEGGPGFELGLLVVEHWRRRRPGF
jgi:hypothetical protein